MSEWAGEWGQRPYDGVGQGVDFALAEEAEGGRGEERVLDEREVDLGQAQHGLLGGEGLQQLVAHLVHVDPAERTQGMLRWRSSREVKVAGCGYEVMLTISAWISEIIVFLRICTHDCIHLWALL